MAVCLFRLFSTPALNVLAPQNIHSETVCCHVRRTALNNASGQRREMRAIARKKLEPTGGLFKNGLHLYGVPCDKNNANG